MVQLHSIIVPCASGAVTLALVINQENAVDGVDIGAGCTVS